MAGWWCSTVQRHRFRPGLPVLFAFFFQNGQGP